MKRKFLFAVALFTALCPGSRLPAAFRGEIIPQTTAARHGLTRSWFTQIHLDRGQSRVRDVVLDRGVLFVQTDRAVIHAIDAETGETIWSKIVGRPNHPSMTPGLSKDLLVSINGSRLYVVNRYNGDLLYETQIDGAPGAGAGVSDKRAYIPTVTGLVLAYRLEPLTDPLKELGKIKKNLTEEQQAEAEEYRRENLRVRQEYIPPLACQSTGRALVQPLVAREDADQEFVVWPTDRGYLHIGYVNLRGSERLTVKYRLETDAGIAARPTYRPADPEVLNDSGEIFAASRDGFVHSIREKSGESLWRFSTGEPILEPAVVINQCVYVATQPGGMYCIDADTGKELWWAPDVKHFIAGSKRRVYAGDRMGRIVILRADTGARLDAMPAASLPIRMINTETDRLYLATRTGLIQCLHEVELTEPLQHEQLRGKAPKQGEDIAAKKGPVDKAAGAVQPGGKEDPFADVAGGDKKDPFADAAAGDQKDPFGDDVDGGDQKDPFADDADGGDQKDPDADDADGGDQKDPFADDADGGDDAGDDDGDDDPFGGDAGGDNPFD